MFQLRNLPPCEAKLSGLQVEPISLDMGVARFDLSLEIVDYPKGLECQFEYNSELFDAATIVRLQAHFRNLLENIIGDTDRRISDLPLLTEVERQPCCCRNGRSPEIFLITTDGSFVWTWIGEKFLRKAKRIRLAARQSTTWPM